MDEQSAIIVRCNSCNSWLASTNSMFIQKHLSTCYRADKHKDEISINANNSRESSNNNSSSIILKRKPVIDHNQTIRCIAEIDGIRTKVIVAHIKRGKFIVLSTAVYEYRYMVGRIIDASDICAIIL